MKILNNNNSMTYKLFLTILFSLLYTVGLYFFIRPAQLLTSGISGITQIVEFLTHINYGVLYLILNLPGIYIGWKYIGKKFTIYSITSILTVSITMYVLSNTTHFVISNNDMLNALFGGGLMGLGTGLLLKVGSSSGGTDFFGMYLLKFKNVEFAKVNLIINVSIIVLGTVINLVQGNKTFDQSLEIMMYTIISLYARNVIMDKIFTNNQTITLFIVGDDLTRVSNYINNKLKRGTTIFKNVEGGYTHSPKELIMTTLNKYEYSIFIEFVEEIDDPIFITQFESTIVGNYKLENPNTKDLVV